MIVIQKINIYVIGEKNGKFSRHEFEQRTPEYWPEKRSYEGNLLEVEQVLRAGRRCDQGQGRSRVTGRSKYGLPQIQAQGEVDALLKGRQIGAGA